MSITNLRNTHTILAKVAEIIAKLPPGHSRAEAFKLINGAFLLDNRGDRIIPSVYYHALTSVTRKSGKSYMGEFYPDFVPTPSPYAKEKVAPKPQIHTPVVTVPNTQTIERMSRTLQALSNELANYLPHDNSIHASIHAGDRNVGQRRRTA